ncbi:hypothetical protein RDWZM_003423 [Blomia tropicalis]|uniref:A-kinase anchor protein 2 C-terminal domain-containing protein n=1 Tax=Blomia tropicalis TaxID=40697 RepID=A0A9Q0MGW0_BLOTA|nr:hypothetical protein RDWZM_003423 [Blomia tropicalis]
MRIYTEEGRKASMGKTLLSPTLSASSTSSLSSCGMTQTSPIADTEQYSSNNQMIKSPTISMHRFINSKGKQMTRDGGLVGAHFHGDSIVGEYNEPRLPRFITNNHNFYRKRLSAIDKIQEELQEMKKREDELRVQRVRSVGMSYPNLNSICDEDFQSSDDQTVESSEENKDSFHSSRCSSNPDISINVRELILDDNTVRSETPLTIGGPRRKIPLIAMWEGRIQELNNDKSTK